jgi:hypothetical protein
MSGRGSTGERSTSRWTAVRNSAGSGKGRLADPNPYQNVNSPPGRDRCGSLFGDPGKSGTSGSKIGRISAIADPPGRGRIVDGTV